MESLMSATAVKWLQDGRVLLATSQSGVFIKERGKWNPCLHIGTKKIRDFHESGAYIYGVGDAGLFIRSSSGGNGWTIKRFPTKATVWNVSSSQNGLVVAHGEKLLFISYNFGETFKVIDPFSNISHNKPSIRSLVLYKNYLFIGTKVHGEHGGVYMINLKTMRCIQVKRESERMTASLTFIDGFLIAGFGSSKGKNGSVEYSSADEILLFQEETTWFKCNGEIQENSYLHISGEKDYIYATSNQNESGYSTVSKICLSNGQIVPYWKVKGHGWRVASDREDFAVAGHYESIFFQRNKDQILLH